MSNLYYPSSYSGASSFYSSYRSGSAAANPYLSDVGPTRVSSVEPYVAGDSSSYSDRASSYFSKQGFGSGVGLTPSLYSSSVFDPSTGVGTKRSVDALYHQTVLGSNNSIGQTEALYSSNSLVKRSKLEIGSNLPVYPQRPGAKDCAYYMMTRTCKFGESCKFDHPIWVPEGGIPNWKEVPLIPTSESLPERPGVSDCPYYMKTQKCKFGLNCKFNHPKDKLSLPTGEIDPEVAIDNSVLPERPSEPVCSFYMKTGKCKFGASCKFHHPKDLQVPSDGQNVIDDGQTESAEIANVLSGDSSNATNSYIPPTPALLHNSKGLPIRPGETDCSFYLKTGSCKYGPTCRFNHPDRLAINPPFAAGLGQAIMPSSASNMHLGILNPAASYLQNIDMQTTQTSLGMVPSIYPQRPGEIECDFYMKTGQCKFAERCKYHHPVDRTIPTAGLKHASQQIVKLTLAGLPRREGAVICSFYMKTGTCKYGVTCRFDHPPPGEAIAMATVQGTGNGDGAGVTTVGGENSGEQ